MSTVGIRALKQNASAVVAEVVGGEVVTITDRGRPVAQITRLPIGRLQALVESGVARLPRRSARDLRMPEALRPSAPSMTDVLRSMRDDERY
jgi:antitoxin (DNA-binding transcriptional repressor) of toxin-antitoxin stability system